MRAAEVLRCAWRANEPQPLGCPAFAWITHDELAHYEFPAADARLLERLRQPAGWRQDRQGN